MAEPKLRVVPRPDLPEKTKKRRGLPKNVVKRTRRNKDGVVTSETYYLRLMIDGTCYHRPLGATLAEAKRRRDAVEREIRAEIEAKHNGDTPTEPHTVATFVDRWLRERITRGRVTEKGRKMKRTRMDRYVLPVIGDMPLDKVDGAACWRVQANLLEYRIGKDRRLAVQTVRHVLADLQAVLLYAARVKAISLSRDDVASLFEDMLGGLKVPEELPDWLTDEEVADILADAKPPNVWTLILLLETGMRWGEVHGLEWTKHVQWTPRPKLMIERTKGKKVRRIPLSPAAVEALQALKAWPNRVGDYVIPTRSEHPGFLYRSSRKRLGFHWHVHRCRHTFAIRFLNSGGSLAALQQLLGHSDIKLTLRYAKVTDTLVDAEADRVFATTGWGRTQTGSQASQGGGKP